MGKAHVHKNDSKKCLSVYKMICRGDKKYTRQKVYAHKLMKDTGLAKTTWKICAKCMILII